jgi:PAS domain S-box-containing protein
MRRDASGKFVSNWDSESKQRVSISLTNTAWRSLDEEARRQGISRSELIERVARSFGNERQQQFLIELNDTIRAIQDSKEIMWQVERATGQHFNVTRCTYGEIDDAQEYVIVKQDYCNGVISVAGNHYLDSFGIEIIAELKQGKTLVINDVDVDPRTRNSGAATFAAIQTKAVLCVPLVKEGRFVALFVLHHVSPRHWTEEDVTLMEQIAEQTWLAVERSQAEEALSKSQARLQLAQRQLATIFETSPVGIGLLDKQQRFIAINEALAQINGLTREQHLGYSIPELFGQSDPKLVEVFHEIYTTGNPFISPSFAVNVPGRWDRTPGYYNVYYLPTTNSHREVEEVLVYVVDVTERVRLEQGQRFLSEASAVLASSLDYQTTLERVAQLAVPELADWCTVHMIEEDGSIEQIAVAHNDPVKLQWAQEIRHKYPLNPNEPRGAALTLRTGQSDILPNIPDELLVQAARDPEHLEILRQVGFRSVMSVSLRTQERILGVISFVSAESGRQYDSTDLELAEELARRASLAIDNAQLYRVAQLARAKAESANRVKDEFLAVLSHELRSPLNPILGWTKMLRSHRLDATRTEQALETIERNAKLQAQLIEDLLDVSRILQGKMTLNVAPVNLAATIEAAKETVRLAAEAKNIHIQTALNPISGSVSGDKNRLQQVFWNLLSNAVKFTPSGGRVEVRLEQLDTYAQIQVKDTGIGISPEFLPHVFEYFRQANSTTTRQFGGLGLGLAIVRQITELHGGTVWANSAGENLGATFTVRLPLNVVEQVFFTNDSPSESKIQLADIEILVVDDNEDMRELAKFILMESGARVITAGSAVKALNCLNRSVPDMLLCDIGMPEMDGYSLIQYIRKLSPLQGGTIPAIALTAFAGEINQQQALAAGFNMHLSKPVEPEKLVEAIIQLLNVVAPQRKEGS